MRVLHVIPSVSPKHGGPSYAVAAYARALQVEGVECAIATTDDDGAARMAVRLGVEVERGGTPHYFFRRDLLPYKVSLGLYRWLDLNADKFDVLHIHALFSFSSSAAARIALRGNIPYVVRPLGVLNRWGLEDRRRLLKRLSLRWVELPLLEKASALHFTTEAEAEEAMMCDSGLNRVRQAIIPVPVEAGPPGDRSIIERRFPPLIGRKIILFLSRIDPKKGIELLLEAFAIARREDPSVALLMAGEGERHYVDALKQKSRELRVEPDVTWAGHLAGEEKASALAMARVFVLPSHSENFGVAAVEALAAGVSVILSPEVAVSFDVGSHDAGLVVARDARAIATGISQILSQADKARLRAENGRKLVEERYSFPAVGAALHQLYRSILSGPTNA